MTLSITIWSKGVRYFINQKIVVLFSKKRISSKIKFLLMIGVLLIWNETFCREKFSPKSGKKNQSQKSVILHLKFHSTNFSSV